MQHNVQQWLNSGWTVVNSGWTDADRQRHPWGISHGDPFGMGIFTLRAEHVSFSTLACSSRKFCMPCNVMHPHSKQRSKVQEMRRIYFQELSHLGGKLNPSKFNWWPCLPRLSPSKSRPAQPADGSQVYEGGLGGTISLDLWIQARDLWRI